MSEKTRIDSMMEELIHLDPSLGEREADLRGLVTLFIEKRPSAVPNPAFVTSLRARLLLRTHPVRSPFFDSLWLLSRLAPVGMVAILLLILAPAGLFEYERFPNKDMVLNEIAKDPRVLDVRTGEAPSNPGIYGMGGGGSGPMGIASSPGADTSMKMATETAMPVYQGTLTVGVQTPGTLAVIESVTTDTPGFIVITESTPEGTPVIIGVSSLILPGTVVSLPINLSVEMRPGGLYTATFHSDNGDRVFDETVDFPKESAPETPSTVVFIAE